MIEKIRAASCSLMMLLLVLALVTSSLLVARYAVHASSWWLSLLAVLVCLLGLCTWIQLAASRASRWRALLARHAAQLRQLQRERDLDLDRDSDIVVAHISGGALDSPRAQSQTQLPPPPPYALSDLPPSYGVAQGAGLPEPPPPYCEAVKGEAAPAPAPQTATPTREQQQQQQQQPAAGGRQPYLWC